MRDKNYLQSEIDINFSNACVSLMKGIVIRDSHEKIWFTILQRQYEIEEYFKKIGLTLVCAEDDGYAYLKQSEAEETKEILKLVTQHQIGFNESLLLALLRKYLLKNNEMVDQKIVISQKEIQDMMKVFLRKSTNEANLDKKINSSIEKIEELKFIRKLKNNDEDKKYEIMRLIATFIDAQWLNDLDKHLEEYLKAVEKNMEDE